MSAQQTPRRAPDGFVRYGNATFLSPGESVPEGATPFWLTVETSPSTPSSRWAADGKPDPHGTDYDCERASLTLGHYTDDELANAVFVHGGEPINVDRLARDPSYIPGTAFLTAAKDRIRWLSRQLVKATAPRRIDDASIMATALDIARRAAKARPESYYAEPFQPHDWVLDALVEALTCAKAPPAVPSSLEVPALYVAHPGGRYSLATPDVIRDAAAAAAGEDTARLDLLESRRIAVTPEFEGGWDADVYDESGTPVLKATGATVRAAIDAAAVSA
jgi:hypothetical protein